mmetsp:Transcript_1384/g.4810  ORF Transcript_1384/g.4810 Transcript_1384/m.4810 type:complete len:286 (+) Transcript_1384:2307-3164(+)
MPEPTQDRTTVPEALWGCKSKTTPNWSLMCRRLCTVCCVIFPRRTLLTSSGVRAHRLSRKLWCNESTTPPRRTSSNSCAAASSPTSSGSAILAPRSLPRALPPVWLLGTSMSPPLERASGSEQHSAQSSTPVVVSATRAMPKPGLLAASRPLEWSVKMYTSGSSLLSSARAASTMRLHICGDTFVPNATPLTRLTRPSSVQSTGVRLRTMGTRRSASPPPSGRTPRRRTRSSSAAASTPNLRRSGSVAVRIVSTDGSSWSLVMPVSVSASGFFANSASSTATSTK